MIRDAVMQMAQSDPRYAKAIDAIEAQVSRMPIVPEDLDDAIALLEFVLQHPDKYQEVRDAAVKDGLIDEQMFPADYDQVFVVSLLIALYGLHDRLKTQGYARGGLATAARRVAAAGRGGDSMLAHINPREAEMLRRMGGSGTVNPNTGLQEYKGGIGKILKAVIPIATMVFAPVLAPAIGSFLGATGVAGSVLGGAVLGGASSALTGGNVLQGAALGGLGGGLGNVVGGAANSALGLNLGSAGQAILGSGLVGAGAGLATGQGALQGAAQGVLGGAIGQLAGMANAPTAFQQAVQGAGQTAGNVFSAGYGAKNALTAGTLAGLARGLTFKPSDQVVGSLQGEKTTPYGEQPSANVTDWNAQNALNNQIDSWSAEGAAPVSAETAGMPQAANTYDWSMGQGAAPAAASSDQVANTYDWSMPGSPVGELAPVSPTAYTGTNVTTNPTNQPPAAKSSVLSKIFSGSDQAAGKSPSTLGTVGKLALGATLIGSLTSAPEPVQQAVSSLSPQQQEYFNRPSVTFDWGRLQNDANAANMSLPQFMARNWPTINSGVYNVVKQARGGALSAVARFARGAGSGRDDTINAKLSDGEYVMDAETVALLGDGSNEEGARRLDKMREDVRAHKGKMLAKGKISPNAKSPLAYLKGVA
jgi:hypothetical protein